MVGLLTMSSGRGVVGRGREAPGGKEQRENTKQKGRRERETERARDGSLGAGFSWHWDEQSSASLSLVSRQEFPVLWSARFGRCRVAISCD